LIALSSKGGISLVVAPCNGFPYYNMLWVICDHSCRARASLGHRDFCWLLGKGKWDMSKNSVDGVVTFNGTILWHGKATENSISIQLETLA